MFGSIFTTLQSDAASVYGWWDSMDSSYRGAGCLLLGLFLMWEATKAAEGRDLKFFVLGIAALSLLAYGAMIFTHH
jgi:hypothetical protein